MVLRGEKLSRQFLRKSGSSNVFTAVSETDLVLAEGKLTEITGRSGSGKSTLLNMMAGLLTPTSGKVFFGETDLYALPDDERSVLRNRCFGVIPQGQTGLGSLTVLENVLLPAQMYGKDPVPVEKGMQLLEQVGIAELRDEYPNALSGGEMRRLAIARAMIRNPSVLFADEPTGDLDDENTEVVLRMLRDAADSGMAVLLVTHEAAAKTYADAMYRMDGGRLLAEQSENS